MANFITTKGYAAVLPQITATLNNHPTHGRSLTVSDRFAEPGARNVLVIRGLQKGAKVTPILAAHGFAVAGPWKASGTRAIAVLREI